MQRYCRSLLVLCCLLSSAAPAFAQCAAPTPCPGDPTVTANYVFDDANVLFDPQRQKLNELLVRHEQKGAGGLYLCLIEELPGGLTASEYAAQRLKRLPPRTPNGRALLLVVLGEQRLEIYTDWRLRAALTEEESRRICQNTIRPFFDRGQYLPGLQTGLEQIGKKLSDGRRLPPPSWFQAAFSFTSEEFSSWTKPRLYLLGLGGLLLLWGLSHLLLITLHEAGHALVARLLGLRVFTVTIGGGRQLCAFTLAGVRVQINLFPGGGSTALAIPPDYQQGNPALALALSILAGPGTHFIILLLFLFFAPGGRLDAETWGPLLPVFFRNLYLVNLLYLFVNLLPVKAYDFHQTSFLDGYQIWQVLTNRAEMLTSYRLAYFLHGGAEYKRAERYDLALAHYQQGLAREPENPLLLMLTAGAHRCLGNHRAARDCARAAREACRAPKYDLLKIALLNDIAYADALLARADLLPEADEFSQEALRTFGHEPNIIGTRGAVLLRLGRLDEGVRLLQTAYQLSKEPQERAEEACWLALGETLRGDFAAADKWWGIVQAGKPQAYLKRQIEREMQLLRNQSNPFVDAYATRPLTTFAHSN